MGVLASVGGRLVTLKEADSIVRAAQPALDDYILGGKPLAKGLKVAGLSAAISRRTLQELRDDSDPVKPFRKVGANRPLSMVLEYVYLGDLPDAAKWNPLADAGDVLVTSANRPFEKGEPGARAIHFLQPKAKPFTPLRASATGKGTPLMYYSPAETNVSILATIEMSLDRDFDEALTDKLGQAVGAAAALPLFAPAAPWLIGASIAIPLAGKFANLMMKPNTFFRCSEQINITRPGLKVAEAGALVLYPDNDPSAFEGYELDAAKFRLQKGSKEYKGELPYAVMTLDGTDRPQWEGWQATATTADMVERFFGSGGGLTGVIDIVSKSLELYNDLTYQRRAAAIKKELNSEKNAARKEKLEAELKALTKNIRNEELRKSV
jgi:hypothetical protein